MASTISAGTTSGTALNLTGDTTGNLAFTTGAGANTITVPNETGTIITNKTTGTVLQVVNATYSTQVTTASATYISTGLTASITPKFSTSKILVLVSQSGFDKGPQLTYMGLRLIRGASTVIATMGTEIMYTGTSAIPNGDGGASISYLDSPATTSSTTYTTQFNNAPAVGSVYVQVGGETSTITLMEIAA